MSPLDRLEQLADSVGSTSLGRSDAESLAYALQDLLPLIRQWAEADAEVQRIVLGASSRKRIAERHLLAALRGEP